MNEKDLLRRAIKSRGVTQEELAKKYGYASQGGIQSILNPKTSMRVDVLVRMLDLLDYDVCIVDRGTRHNLGRITTIKTGATKRKPKSEEQSEPKEIPVFKYGK